MLWAAAPPVPLETGESVAGRVIRARRSGDPQAARRVLVVGCLHGDECAGVRVVRALRRVGSRAGVDVWTVETANPDGRRRRTRQNLRGVDLNRNFPTGWRPLDRPGGVYWSGPRPASEPETQAMQQMVRRLRPDVTVWFHQALACVVRAPGAGALQRSYARAVRLPLCRLEYPGTATRWQRALDPGAAVWVTELRAGPLDRAEVRRHTRAILAAGRRARG